MHLETSTKPFLFNETYLMPPICGTPQQIAHWPGVSNPLPNERRPDGGLLPAAYFKNFPDAEMINEYSYDLNS